MSDEAFNQGSGPPPVHAVERVTEGVPEGLAVIALAGELDLSCADDFRAAVEAAGQEGVRRVVVDLADAPFMDSSILKELLRANAELREAGVELVLVAPQPPVQRLLELTRTTEMFTLADDRASALG